MAGALTERDFVDKMANVGFTETLVQERRAFGLSDAELYPLFTPDLIELMRTLLTPQVQDEVAVAVTLVARKPG